MADAVRISTPVCDVTDRGDNKPWTFASVMRNDAGRLVTDTERPITPEGGLLVVDLIPGLVEARHGNKVYRFLVPEVMPEGHTLANLLEDAFAYPANTPQELLAAAVGQYLIQHGDELAIDEVIRVGGTLLFRRSGVTLGSAVDVSDLVFNGDIDSITDAQAPAKELIRAVTQLAARAAIGAIGTTELEAKVSAAVSAEPTVVAAAAAAAETAVDNKVDGLNLVEAEDITVDDYLFAIVDSDDRVAVVIGVDGSTRIYKFDPASIGEGSITTAQLSEVTQSQLVAPSVGSLLLGLSAASGYLWAVVDSLGRVALGVRTDGKVVANLVEDSAPLLVPEVSGFSPTRKLWALNQTTGVRELVSETDDPRDAVSHDGVILFTDDGGRKVFNGEVIPAWPDRSTIACWGDSLVEIGGWAEELDTLLSASVVNLGGSGQTTEEVAIRQGGIELTVTVSGGEIPASGSVSCSSAQDILVTASGTTWSQAGTLAGVAGTLSRADGDGFDTLTFTRSGSGSAVSVDEAAFVSDAAVAYESNPVIILAGRNDHWAAGVEADFAADVVAAYDAMINRLRVYHKEFLILGTATPTESTAGSFNWARMTTANQALKLKYGNRFLDLQDYMVNDCIYDLGITPTPTDVTAMANKTLPPSIMNPDLSHFSTAAGEAAAVNLIKPKLDELGWTL